MLPEATLAIHRDILPDARVGVSVPTGNARRLRRPEAVVVALLILVAGAVRLPGLEQVPPGLHFDEAYNALDALGVLQGHRPVFFEGNFGREPLFIYLLAAAFSLFPPGPALIRAVSAVAGVLAVPLTYGIGRLLFPGSRWPAVLAALVQAFLPWDLHFSRYGLRVELLPLLGNAALLCLLLGWRSGRRAWYVASGGFLGLALYGYMAARLLPVVVAVWGAVWLWRSGRPERKRVALNLGLVAVTAALVVAPLAAYFLRHPDSFSHRAGQVLIKGEPRERVVTVAANVWAWAKALFVQGDANPRNNLPGAPALTPWLALPGLVGLLFAFRGRRGPAAGSLLAWFGIMLLPSVLTDHAPSFQRAIGAAPPLCLLVGWGLDEWRGLVLRLSGRRWVAGLVASAVLVGHAGQALHQYFVRWGTDNALYYAFDEGIYQIGQYMRQATLEGQRVYLSPVRPDHATLHFVMRDVGGPATFDGRETFVLPPGGAGPVQYLVLVREDHLTLSKVRTLYPEAVEEHVFRDRLGQAYAVALLGLEPRFPAPPRMPRLTARWETGIALEGLAVRVELPRINQVRFYVFWSADSSQPEDYTAFVHFIGPPNPETGTPLWCQSDSMPGAGTYPTSHWRPGEIVVDSHTLDLPEGLPDGEYYVEIGWYLLSTGERLLLADPDAGSDTLLLGPFTMRDGRVERDGA